MSNPFSFDISFPSGSSDPSAPTPSDPAQPPMLDSPPSDYTPADSTPPVSTPNDTTSPGSQTPDSTSPDSGPQVCSPPASQPPDSVDSAPASSEREDVPPIAVNAVPVPSGGGGAAPSVLVNVTPQYTRADWHWVAMTTAFGLSTAKAIRDKKAWNVGSGSSFQANKDIIHAAYDYYGQTYFKNPSKCCWAGLGRVAGGPFFWGFQFIDNWIRSIEADPCFRPEKWWQIMMCAPRSGFNGSGTDSMDQSGVRLANEIIHANCQTAIEALMQMGRYIFDDLAWQHEAYLDGGLKEILRLNGQLGVFDQRKERQEECVNAWTLIDSSDPSGPIKGNRDLFRREQLYTISAGYATLHGIPVLPTFMSFLAHSPHPWGTGFYPFWQEPPPPTSAWGGDPTAGPIPSAQSWLGAMWSHDVTVDADRWSWMSNNIYPTWMAPTVSENKRGLMVGLTLENLVAHNWPPGL